MAEEFDFSGTTILVTGAASGIGAATGRWLAAHGAQRLVLVDRGAELLVPAQFGCAVEAFAGDVGDPALWDRLEREAPGLDHAVLNAGISSGGAIADCSFEEWRRVMTTNLDGAFLSLRTALRKVRDGGSIVLTSSVSGLKAEPGTAAYGASKAAVIQLAKVAAREAAPRRVRVNAIAPGGVDTPIWDQAPFFQDLVKQHGGDRTAALTAMAGMATPLGRFATADEIARQIGFLLSDLAAMTTGTVLITDGGYSV
ncbi:MAG TPA: SDR family oxidoreductase [Sphingomicrobium sp.]